MSLTVAVQMDPLEKIGIAGDLTFALMLKAQQRGHGCSITWPRILGMKTAGFAPAPGRSRCNGSKAIISAWATGRRSTSRPTSMSC